MKDASYQDKYVAMMANALEGTHHTADNLPYKTPSYFAPCVLQREFAVVALGDKIGDRVISHIATLGIASCLAVVLHKGGNNPVTALTHFDSATDLGQSLGSMLSAFGTTPDQAIVFSGAFDHEFKQNLINNGMNADDAAELIDVIKSERLQQVCDLGALLHERGIELKSAKLDVPHSTFITEVKTGQVWAGAEETGMVWHNRDDLAHLRHFYATGENMRTGPVTNPYAHLIVSQP